MRKRILLVGCLILFLLLSGTLPVSGSPYDDAPEWNSSWPYRQQLQLPISTDKLGVTAQPIDLFVSFDNPCWAYNETWHSVRVCCWDGNLWHELESQIYSLQYLPESNSLLKNCNLVFLIPEFANGHEQYYVYYDNEEKNPPRYTDHVGVRDETYYASPLPDITAEATYYEIQQDGYIVYGVGQKGEFLGRSLAQVVVKQRPESTVFDIINADQIASFAFSYSYGKKEEDELSSDQVFVYKTIFSDGNLMVSFGIISESSDGSLRTSVIYKYYYTPTEDKRICVHVEHDVVQDVTIKGDVNLDGRYGALISFKSRNAAVQKLNFGDIFPFVNIYGESNTVEEYPLDQNPESKEKDWVISFTDDVDVGSEGWLTYGEGKQGKAHGLIFCSNTGLVQSGTNERDGIQVKVAEREYFDFLGTEIDYASINFGRNSYEKGYSHDIVIPGDFVVEFDAELFSSEEGGYPAVQQEAVLYRELVKCRSVPTEGSFQQQQKKYSVTVVSHFGGTRFTFPWLVDKTGLMLPVMYIELVSPDGTLVSSGSAERSLLARGFKTFTNITAGTYLVKVYRMIGNSSRVFVGARVVHVKKYMVVHVFCTWQRTIQFRCVDQKNASISGIRVVVFNDDEIVFAENTTDTSGAAVLYIPHSTKDVYKVKAWYYDFLVYSDTLEKNRRKVSLDVTVELHDLTIEVRDRLGFPPGVSVHPLLSSITYPEVSPVISLEQASGTFVFDQIPSGRYHLQLGYGSISDEKDIDVPVDGNVVYLDFTAAYSLHLALFDSQGNPICDDSLHTIISRDGKTVQDNIKNQEIVVLPPAWYTLRVYEGDTLVGQNKVYLTSDQTVQLVTSLQSLIPIIIVIVCVIGLGMISVGLFLKKLTVSTFVKCCVLVFLLFSVIQPWWVFSGSNTSSGIERDIQMNVYPQVMIETTRSPDTIIYSLAVLPDIFLDFLGNILLGLGVGCFILGISVVLDLLRKRKYSFVLSVVCALVLLVLVAAYYTGTAKLCEVSVGDIQGSGSLNFTINEVSVTLSSSWGLGIGFYLVILSAVILIGLSIWMCIQRFFKKKEW